jgi:hypothetical protein
MLAPNNPLRQETLGASQQHPGTHTGISTGQQVQGSVAVSTI